jgi:hypothetical protein
MNPVSDTPTLEASERSFSTETMLPDHARKEAYMAACTLVHLMVWTADLSFRNLTKLHGCSDILLFDVE